MTLDPDVEQLLRDAMQRRRLSFKAALNEAIRSGLAEMVVSGAKEGRFIVRSRGMGLRAGIDAARLNQMADELEAESFQALGRALGTRRRRSS